jgi:hypothetical protein
LLIFVLGERRFSCRNSDHALHLLLSLFVEYCWLAFQELDDGEALRCVCHRSSPPAPLSRGCLFLSSMLWVFCLFFWVDSGLCHSGFHSSLFHSLSLPLPSFQPPSPFDPHCFRSEKLCLCDAVPPEPIPQHSHAVAETSNRQPSFCCCSKRREEKRASSKTAKRLFSLSLLVFF